MLDIGWSEMLVIAIVLIVVVGPKDLPRMLRTFGKTTTKMRSMAGEFRKQFDEAIKEAELEDLKSVADSARKLNPTSEIKKALNPMEKAAQDVRAGLDKAMNPKPVAKPAEAPKPASSEAKPAEPLKAGPAAIPGENKTKAEPPAKPSGKTAPAAKATPAAKTAPAAAKAAPAPKAATPKRKAAASTSAASAKKPQAAARQTKKKTT